MKKPCKQKVFSEEQNTTTQQEPFYRVTLNSIHV